MTSNNIRLTNVNSLKKNYYSIHFCEAKLRSNIFERFRPKYLDLEELPVDEDAEDLPEIELS